MSWWGVLLASATCLVAGICVGFGFRDHLAAWITGQFTYGGGWGDSQ